MYIRKLELKRKSAQNAGSTVRSSGVKTHPQKNGSVNGRVSRNFTMPTNQ